MSHRQRSTTHAHPACIRRARAIAWAALLLVSPALASAQPNGETAGQTGTDERPAQILLIPIGGELPESFAGLPAKLTATTADAIRAHGAEPVTAKIEAADIAAVTGCPAESRECFDLIASTIDVGEVVFGTVEPAESGEGVDISLTSIRPDETPWQRRIHLDATDEDQAVAQFQEPVARFLRREEPQPKPDLTVKQPPPPPPVQKQPDMSAFSLARVKPYSWALTGGGGLLIGLGIYMLVQAADKHDDLVNARDETVADLERMKDIEEDGKRLTSLGNGFLIGGAVFAIAGIALGARQATTRPEQKPAPVSVTPVAVRGGAGFSLVFRGDL